MLPLPRFRFLVPRSLDDALATLAAHGSAARPIAGGTDLVPNLKHRLLDVDVLVPLKRLPGMRGVTRSADGALALGALTSLSALAADPVLASAYPALADAVGHIAGPQLRNMGTIGGNPASTRAAPGTTRPRLAHRARLRLKRTGTVCHVVPAGRAASRRSRRLGADESPRSAARWYSSARARAHVALDTFFLGEGRKNTVVEPDEILTEVRLPAPAQGAFGGYQKLRPRGVIDFPMLSVAVAGTRAEDGTIKTARVVVGALGAKPREVSGVTALVAGQAPSREVFEAVGAQAFRQCRPLTNIATDPEWRHAMVPVLVRRAFAQALGQERAVPVLEVA
jgi:4-hydroxybenzoyl-CoA reductase subunit beta